MSLLMDALKRAEASKQDAARAAPARESPPPAGESLSLEPLPADAGRSGSKPLPDLATHLDAVDADLASAIGPKAPAPAPAAKPAPAAQARPADMEIARNAFAAKQNPAPPSKAPLWVALGTLLVAGLAIGAYFWFQLSGLNASTMTPPPRPPLAPVASPPPPPAAPAVLASAPVSAAPAEPRLFSPPAEPRPQRPPAMAAEPAAYPPIRLTRSRPEPDSNLAQGLASVQQNDLERANRSFEQVLRRDPNNTDALLALAAIAQREGRPRDADQLYQRALVANPSDPAVQAAVLNSPAAGADPHATESRLKTLLAAQPESAALNFALGNLYARQQRWSDAQQAYFSAVAAEGDNPDYLFNLAVSLDHIRQPRPAAQHYRLALEAAGRRPAAFDREQVRRRLAELQPERQP